MDNVTNGSIGVFAGAGTWLTARAYGRSGEIGQLLKQELTLWYNMDNARIAVRNAKLFDEFSNQLDDALRISKQNLAEYRSTQFGQFPAWFVKFRRFLVLKINTYSALTAAIALGAIIGYNWNGWFGKGGG